MDYRCRRGRRDQQWHVGNRSALATGSSGKFAGLLVPVWLGNRHAHLFHHFPLMVLFIIFCPIVAAALIIAGLPAPKTPLAASAFTLGTTFFLPGVFQQRPRDFQHVTSFTISPEWHLSFTTGLDSLSFVMVLLPDIQTPPARWLPGRATNS